MWPDFPGLTTLMSADSNKSVRSWDAQLRSSFSSLPTLPLLEQFCFALILLCINIPAPKSKSVSDKGYPVCTRIRETTLQASAEDMFPYERSVLGVIGLIPGPHACQAGALLLELSYAPGPFCFHFFRCLLLFPKPWT
jgi:hypothetical protein